MFQLLIAAAWAAPPDPPALDGPDDASEVASPVSLRVRVDDPDGGALTARFFGREVAPPGAPYHIIAMPDTQYYACGCDGGSPETFTAQTDWIAGAREPLSIAFVTQVGDCVENGDEAPGEWAVADDAFSRLEDPETTGLAEGVPYGIAVGNHDQSPFGDADGGTELYNATFGVDRFQGRAYYGGHYGDSNDQHYELFEAGGVGWVALHLEYDESPDQAVLDWAAGVLADHPDRRAMVTTHFMVDVEGRFSTQGEAIYEALKHAPGLTLMFGGHILGEGRRSDTFEGRTVHAMLSNFQGRDNGGDGLLRRLEIDPAAGEVQVRTYSVTREQYETDADSEFTLPIDAGPPLQLLGETAVASGEVAEIAWPDLTPGATYEWYAVADDGRDVVASERWTFTAAGSLGGDSGGGGDSEVETGAGSDSGPSEEIAIAPACGCGASGAGGLVGGPAGAWWLALALVGWRRNDRAGGLGRR